MWFKPLEGSNIRKIILDSENNLVAFTQRDSRIYKINSATGETIWERNVADSVQHITNLYDLGVDQLNNVIVTGNNSNNNANIQIKKLSSSGEELWFTEYNSQEDLNDLPTALALDSENNIYITGTAADSISKTYVIKLSTEGDLIWEYTLSEVSYEQQYLWPIIVRDSSLFIGGSLYDYLTKSNIFIMKLDQTIGTGINEKFFNPYSYTLSQNYPNPFNPSTVISYRLPVTSNVSLKVYDVLGNEIATLVNEEKPAGEYEVEFNAAKLPSGIYFYKLEAGSFSETKKMILMK
ncbi:MAG: T9SS type A sorting domain-containing protein [bacterium]|nr:T9SS type A sorting domain-containing protein [bacterium]